MRYLRTWGPYAGLNVFGGLWLYLKEFFSLTSLTSWRWWIYVVLSCTICLHMNLSKPDIEGSLSGLLFTIILFFIIPIITALINLKTLSVMHVVNNAMITGGVYYVGILITAVAFVYLLAIIAAIIAGIVKLFKRIIPHKSAKPANRSAKPVKESAKPTNKNVKPAK